MLLAEDLGDTFVSFAGRMGIPGVAAGLTSFVLMYWTNRDKVDVHAGTGDDDSHASDCEHLADKDEQEMGIVSPGGEARGGQGDGVGGAASANVPEFTAKGVFCLVRMLAATLISCFLLLLPASFCFLERPSASIRSLLLPAVPF